jgi:hypothetical protein
MLLVRLFETGWCGNPIANHTKSAWRGIPTAELDHFLLRKKVGTRTVLAKTRLRPTADFV